MKAKPHTLRDRNIIAYVFLGMVFAVCNSFSQGFDGTDKVPNGFLKTYNLQKEDLLGVQFYISRDVKLHANRSGQTRIDKRIVGMFKK